MKTEPIKIEPGHLRARIAPSPTGALHIGTARTALFNFLLARRFGGKFILRIEDTDLSRSDKKYEKDIIENLKWLGIIWDEGPDKGGPYAPYRQTERTDIYRNYIQKLLDQGLAFYCFHSQKELDEEKKNQLIQKIPQRHICSFRDLDINEVKKKSKKKSIIRLKTPQKIVNFSDFLKGQVVFDASLLGDIALSKDIETPLYNFAVVIDDFTMRINYVMRGEDHLSNTPKQILIQEALELDKVNYIHLPLIFDPNRKKLSKRFGAASVAEYRRVGYLPEALINFLVLMGWNPGTNQEIFNLEGLEKDFFLEGLQTSAAVFNIEKLNWLNGEYLKKINADKFYELALPYLEKKKFFEKRLFSKEKLEKILILEKARISKLNEVGESIDFFFKKTLIYPASLLFWQKTDKKETKEILTRLKKIISEISDRKFNPDNLKNLLFNEAGKFENKGYLLWPLRVALSGKKNSPGPFEIMDILGKKDTLQRIASAIKKLNLPA
ncbi:MAG: glutamate--tRNA ligase [Parcubacteria group bacterium]|nr:glutamate--tRNA ligase [Parcubacteria group bacterium]